MTIGWMTLVNQSFKQLISILNQFTTSSMIMWDVKYIIIDINLLYLAKLMRTFLLRYDVSNKKSGTLTTAQKLIHIIR